METYGIIGAVIAAVVSGIAALVVWAVKTGKDDAKQIGRNEVIKDVQQAEIVANRKAGAILSEHRDTAGTTKRLSDGSF